MEKSLKSKLKKYREELEIPIDIEIELAYKNFKDDTLGECKCWDGLGKIYSITLHQDLKKYSAMFDYYLLHELLHIKKFYHSKNFFIILNKSSKKLNIPNRNEEYERWANRK